MPPNSSPLCRLVDDVCRTDDEYRFFRARRWLVPRLGLLLEHACPPSVGGRGHNVPRGLLLWMQKLAAALISKANLMGHRLLDEALGMLQGRAENLDQRLQVGYRVRYGLGIEWA